MKKDNPGFSTCSVTQESTLWIFRCWDLPKCIRIPPSSIDSRTSRSSSLVGLTIANSEAIPQHIIAILHEKRCGYSIRALLFGWLSIVRHIILNRPMSVFIYLLALPRGPLASKSRGLGYVVDTIRARSRSKRPNHICAQTLKKGHDYNLDLSGTLFIQTCSISIGAKSGRQTIQERRTGLAGNGTRKTVVCRHQWSFSGGAPVLAGPDPQSPELSSLRFLPAHDATHSNASTTILTWILRESPTNLKEALVVPWNKAATFCNICSVARTSNNGACRLQNRVPEQRRLRGPGLCNQFLQHLGRPDQERGMGIALSDRCRAGHGARHGLRPRRSVGISFSARCFREYHDMGQVLTIVQKSASSGKRCGKR